jgi:hypothetical protein
MKGISYRHLYHAGGFVDVLKHSLLLHAIADAKEALGTSSSQSSQEAQGLVFVDTHSGGGLYDLFSGSAQRSREFDRGIGRYVRSKPVILFGTFLFSLNLFSCLLLAHNSTRCREIKGRGVGGGREGGREGGGGGGGGGGGTIVEILGLIVALRCRDTR